MTRPRMSQEGLGAESFGARQPPAHGHLGDAEGSTAIAWAFLQPSFTGFPRTISRALQARGFIEEVLAALHET